MQWSRDLRENIAVQWLTFGIRPSLTTLYEFRDRVAPRLEGLNRQVIRTAIDEGHTRGSCGALDGTTVPANATRHRMVNLETVEARLEVLEREIAEAERSESGEVETAEVPTPDGPTSPSIGAETVEVATPDDPTSPQVGASPAPHASGPRETSWKAETLRGKRRQRENYRRAREILRARREANARRRKDKRKREGKIKVALGDPMAPLGLDKLKTYRPLYNVQVMSDVETDLVLAYATTPTTVDSGQLLPMIDRTEETTGRPMKEVLVDAGYPSGEELAACEGRDVMVYAPWHENSFSESKRAAKEGKVQIPKDRFVFDPSARSYRCPEGKVLNYRERSSKQKADGTYFAIEIYQAAPSDCGECPQKGVCMRKGSRARTVRRQEHEERIEDLKERMARPEAKELYGKRCQTVERRIADLKTNRGLGGFSGRTPARADAQVGLAVLGHNLQTLEKLRAGKGRAASTAKTTG